MNSSSLQSENPVTKPRLVDGRISSSTTSFLKWFPYAWTAFSLVIVSVGLGTLLRNQIVDWFGIALLLSVLLVVLGVGGVLIKLTGNFADEVTVRGGKLVIRKGSREIAVAKEAIQSLSFNKWVNPPIAKVELRNESEFGRTIWFFAPLGTSALRPSSKLAMLQDWLRSDS